MAIKYNTLEDQKSESYGSKQIIFNSLKDICQNKHDLIYSVLLILFREQPKKYTDVIYSQSRQYFQIVINFSQYRGGAPYHSYTQWWMRPRVGQDVEGGTLRTYWWLGS